MASHIVIDGNAFYEVDDDCVGQREREKMDLEKATGAERIRLTAAQKQCRVKPTQKEKQG